jgi:hypothetical protein
MNYLDKHNLDMIQWYDLEEVRSPAKILIHIYILICAYSRHCGEIEELPNP